MISLALMACGGSSGGTADNGTPTPDTAQPAPDTAQPAPDTAQPAPDTAQPAPDTAQPTPDTAQPTPDTTTCTPQCDGKQCGADGCGSTCGTCPDNGSGCDENGQCVMPTPPVPSGACTNAADQAVIDNQDVETIAKDCAIANLTDASKAAQCIKDATGLSDPCIACFQGTVTCGITNCAFQCLNPDSPDCDPCLESAGCFSEFETCSGVSTADNN